MMQTKSDNARHWIQTNILLRFGVYKLYKEKYKGAQEKDILRLVYRWSKLQNYNWTLHERSCLKNARLKTIGYALFGALIPCGCLVTPHFRRILIGSTKKRVAFSLFALFLAYGNYIQAQSMTMTSFLNLNDSVICYCLFQVMLQPQFKPTRNKWQAQYNLSYVAHRYKDFDLDSKMQNSFA